MKVKNDYSNAKTQRSNAVLTRISMIFVELDKTLKKACNQFDYRLFVAETARFELAGDCSLTVFESAPL